MSITSISIRNFRSIVSLNEKMLDLNIFVGQNDEGKSNVLRALDLFFNHDKNDGYEFDWQRDYCCFAPKRVQKAEEIEIGIVIKPPPSFANRNPVIWKKTWRRDGFYRETIKHEDKTEITPKSKITPFLKAMRFDYVPAIKGKDYFQQLMSKLHDMLEATVADKVHEASGTFTQTINQNTKTILEEILTLLGLTTTIQLPANLRSLFAQLEFTSISAEKPFSLNQRGDGIKVRHIPIVLRWLAKQANHLSAPGRPKTVTVWGYEEPENNLELRRCFDLAKEFVEGSDEIQTFVTTHSPAFYSVFRESDQEKVGLFLVSKDSPQPITKVCRIKADGEIASLDSSMGLMALLEPHFKEARKELTKLRRDVENLTDTTKPTIFCEGPSDKTLFEESLRLFFPAKATAVNVRCSTHHGGGYNWVSEMLIAWSFSRPTAKAVGVFDKDEGAKKCKGDTEKAINNPSSGKKAFSIDLTPGSELRQCYQHHISVPFGPEELLPKDIWDLAETKGWLEDRPNPLFLYRFDRRDVTFDAHIKSVLTDDHLFRMALKRVKLENKEELAEHVTSIRDEVDRKRVLLGVKPTVEECLKKLGFDQL
jgi:AAA ATPase domain